MTYEVSRLQAKSGSVYACRAAAALSAAMLAMFAAGMPAWAQGEPAPAAKGAAPAGKEAAPAAKEAAPAGKEAAPAGKAQAKAGEGKKQSQWVKLCDKIKVAAKGKDGKEEPPQEKQLCSTMFEAIESNTGQIIVSVGLQEIEGAPKQVLAVMVPLGVVIPGGVKLAVYSAEQWARAAKNETIELKDLKTADLKFAHCLPVGCTAEVQATDELLNLLKNNAGLAVLAIWANGNQFTVPVSLAGFAEALAGQPVDNKEYQANRRKLMEQIRQRQAALREKVKEEQMKHLPPPPPGAAAAAKDAAGKEAPAKEAPKQ